MTIAKDFASKLAVAFVAVAMILTAIAPAVQAQETTEDLQKTINDLLAQVAALQTQLGDEDDTTSTPVGKGCGTFTMDLKTGSTGAEVKALQVLLNSDEDTRVAAAGAVGSAGMETEYYGPATAAAVSKFQVKYRAEILSPAGLVNPTGFFGPSTRAQANKLCAGADDSDDSDDDSSSDDEDAELSGEGSLDVFEIDDADETDIEENDEDVAIAELTLEATDGDIQITRMDIALSTDGSDDAWDVFEEISLWIDGEKVADMDASEEDNYLDEDDMTIRFSGLDIVAMEDEEIEVVIGATVMSSVDDVPADWMVEVNEVRYFDADGVATDDDSTGDIDELGDAPVATVTLDEAGSDEEIKFKLASDNPDATDIVVDTDTKTKDETVLVYTIEAEDNDIDLNELWVRLETTNGNVGAIVDDVRLVVDGDEFDAEATTTSATSVDFMFDIDGDVTVDADDSVTVEVVVDFKSTNDGVAYPNAGATIKASVPTALVELTDAEGADDLETAQLKGSATGETHTIVAEGIVVPADSVESEISKVDADGKVYQFQLDFDVTAVEGDYYITDNATTSTAATDGIVYSVSGGSAVLSASIDSTGDEDTTGVFTVREGETETFTLTVTVDPAASGLFRVQLDEVWFSEDTDGESGDDYLPTPASDFRTKEQSIVG